VSRGITRHEHLEDRPVLRLGSRAISLPKAVAAVAWLVILALICSAGPTLIGGPPYPFERRNMFFGLSLINPSKHAEIVDDLGVSWLSLQPHVLWMAIEQEPGVYDWSNLDEEVRALQALGLDITMVLSPLMNAFGEQREELIEIIKTYPSFIHFMRQGVGSEFRLHPQGETLPLWREFVRAAVDRYDGDGANDMPGLRFAVRNWHVVEEYPTPSLPDERDYVSLLQQAHEILHEENPDARVILAGLAGNYAHWFAFMDGFIDDSDAGVVNGVLFSREQMNVDPVWSFRKARYEWMVEHAFDSFDIIDLHAYIPKESFLEGEIDYLRALMSRFGDPKPIWIIEGGGPHKNYPGFPAVNSPADPHFGWGSEKENAEFVVKLHAMSAAKGVERQHWGLGGVKGENAYWDGPWCGMGLLDWSDDHEKPSYHTFDLMVEKLDGFSECTDLSSGSVRAFRFTVGSDPVYVLWNDSEREESIDASALLGDCDVVVTRIVTELDAALAPVVVPPETAPSMALPLSLTPIFVEPI
jgi:hypothetical protein